MGKGVINRYSVKLTRELGKGYTPTRMRYIRQFYMVMSKRPTVSDSLSYSHYCELIWLSQNEITYYIFIAEAQNLSVRQLRERIKSKEYERLSQDAKNKLINNKETSIMDFVKNPIIIKSQTEKDISEKVLQKLILEDIPSFLKELGSGFSFIDNEYKIKIGDVYNYIDLLLFNIDYNCYVVIELKTTELKKQHIGQIQVYMNYINNNIKNLNHDKTIGIIICKKYNKYIIGYSSDKRIYTTTYILK